MFENVILENETIEDAEFVGCEFKKMVFVVNKDKWINIQFGGIT